jgi:hypothetical protein
MIHRVDEVPLSHLEHGGESTNKLTDLDVVQYIRLAPLFGDVFNQLLLRRGLIDLLLRYNCLGQPVIANFVSNKG